MGRPTAPIEAPCPSPLRPGTPLPAATRQVRTRRCTARGHQRRATGGACRHYRPISAPIQRGAVLGSGSGGTGGGKDVGSK